MKRFTLFCTFASLTLLGLSAQTIRDQYDTKAEACADASYQACDAYYTYGQIGWERMVGWRPIQYLDQYEADHRAYNLNMALFLQVNAAAALIDDCEIVAVNQKGRVVGCQCPEPFPDGYPQRHNCTDVASMTVYGEAGDVIRFKIVTGTTPTTLSEAWAEEVYTFRANSVVGLADTDGDGRADALQPLVLHPVSPGDVNRDGTLSIADVAGAIAVLNGDDAPERSQANADYNGNGSVALDDVDALRDALLHDGRQ